MNDWDAIHVRDSSGNLANTPTKVNYVCGTGSFKNYLGNYSGWVTDSDNDKIGDDPENYTGITDNAPLYLDPSDYFLSNDWWLHNPVMYKNTLTRAPKQESLNAGSSLVWVADEWTFSAVNFPAGDANQQTSWTGHLAFTSVPANGHQFQVEMGYADSDGSNFTSSGASVLLTGDGSASRFPFVLSASAFTVPADKHLAVRITNQSGANYSLLVGGGWSYAAAPLNSPSYPAAGDDGITTYYVSPTGDDVRGRDTQTNPFRTIGRAAAIASAGETIKVMDDDDASTDDYEENVTVNKSLTIEVEDADGTAPQVKAADSQQHVFQVAISNVTIRGLDIYGAMNEGMAAIYISAGADAAWEDITLQNNRCGWDEAHRNDYGIYTSWSMDSSTISGNTCNYNLNDGIYLSGDSNTISNNTTSNNGDDGMQLYVDQSTITGNTCNNNDVYGLFLSSSDSNTVTNNTANANGWHGIAVHYGDNNALRGNTANNNQRIGIYLHGTSSDGANHNVLIENTCESNQSSGIEIYRSQYNYLAKNTCNDNPKGIVLIWSDHTTIVGNMVNRATTIFLELYASGDNLIAHNRLLGTAGSSQYGVVLGPLDDASKALYTARNRLFLNQIANHTTNITRHTNAGDNTFSSAQKLSYRYGNTTTALKRYLGNYYSDYAGDDANGDGLGDAQYAQNNVTDSYPLKQTLEQYNLQTWWLNNPKMYRGDMTQTPATLTLNAGASQVWPADQATAQAIAFSASDTWQGFLEFDQSYTYQLGFQLGYSDADGSNFTAAGPSNTHGGTSSDVVFSLGPQSFTIPKGKYLALQITNQGSGNVGLKLGGPWSYLAAPQGSDDYSLPVVFSTITAEVEGQKVVLKWHTESEVGNLGFNVWRGRSKEGPFFKRNRSLISGAGHSATRREYVFTDDDIEEGQTYFYYIESVDIAGHKDRSPVVRATFRNRPAIPSVTRLLPNYPNPFNPETWIPFELAEDADVVVRIYDLQGRLVRKLDLGHLRAGYYVNRASAAHWDGRNGSGEYVASGMYVLQARMGERTFTRRMVILK